MLFPSCLALLSCVSFVFSAVHIESTNPLQFALVANKQNEVLAKNTILAGPANTSVTAISSSSGSEHITHQQVSPTVYRVDVKQEQPYLGIRLEGDVSQYFYGVWEYPWYGSILNSNISFETKGVADSVGVNWSNLRAPFFISSTGYGVYVVTEEIGTVDFTTPGAVQAVFSTSSFTYYLIIPEERYDFKSIIQDYTGFSTRIGMPPDSGYGPTFWSDDFEEDFHGDVMNAQENYYDVVNHLYYNQIHASSMFADRPYGTGNSSFGNFDFDPQYYPTPEQFIANLSAFGYDLQVWVANRAFLDTELYNASVANGWLFPGISPEFFLGPALNLSIPAAYDYFKQKLSYFTSVGVKGYKIDRGEEGEMPVSEQDIQDVLFRQLCYESMSEHWGESNFYNFARSTYDTARSLTAAWNGDSHSNWTGLSYSVTSGIRAGILGFSQWGSDTGGYLRSAAPIASMPSEELWARWMHFSTFSPVFENMLGTNHTPWYPPYTSDLLSILKQTANEHHELIPYIRSYTYQAHRNGPPVLRALFMEAPNDEKSYIIDNEYFFGEQFLVAPIVTEGGTRSVHFPSDATYRRYLDYNNKTAIYTGGTDAMFTMPLTSVPVFVREGSIVPRGDIIQANNKWTKNWKPFLTIELFPSYEIGTTIFPYYNGKQAVNITMTTSKDAGSVVVKYGNLGVGKDEGEFVVYTKNGAITKGIGSATGGSVKFDGVVSLFD